MVQFLFRGLCAPVFTAFNKNLSVNLEVIPKYAKFLADNGIKGILVNGTTGEGMSQSVDERKLVTEEWVKAVKHTKQHLMVQVGGCPLPDVLELTKHAEQVGANSILCLPEVYFKPINIAELINYLNIIEEAAPKTPLLYYHIPVRTGVNINMAEFLKASVGKVPALQGIKYSSNDLEGAVAALKASNGQYVVFLGTNTLMAGMFTLGFDCAIATTLNIFPQYGVQIYKTINESKIDEARNLQNTLTTACYVITKFGGWVPAMKTAMNLLTPVDVGLCRAPIKNLTQEEAKKMNLLLKNISFLKNFSY